VGDSTFGKEDMYLFMESHKNMVELHTLVLTQLQALLKSNEESVKKTDQVLQAISNMTDKMGDYVEKAGQIQIAMAQNQSENTKAHEAIKNYMYVGWVGMASIILLLVLTFIIV